MAKALARRPIVATVRRRSGPSPVVAKLKKQLATARARKRESKSVNLMTAAVVTAAAFGLGYMQKSGSAPTDILGVNAPLAIGVLGAVALPHFVGGTVGRIGSQVGLAALAVGGMQVGAGAPVMSGTGGGWG